MTTAQIDWSLPLQVYKTAWLLFRALTTKRMELDDSKRPVYVKSFSAFSLDNKQYDTFQFTRHNRDSY